jgi:hypothetical protein
VGRREIVDLLGFFDGRGERLLDERVQAPRDRSARAPPDEPTGASQSSDRVDFEAVVDRPSKHASSMEAKLLRRAARRAFSAASGSGRPPRRS